MGASGAANKTVDADERAHTERVETFLDGCVPGRRRGMPWLTLTFAQSADGKIAGEGRRMVKISGDASMRMTHMYAKFKAEADVRMRVRHDAILVGIGTLLNDDPRLNARLLSGVPVDALPRPVVLDSHLRMPLGCRLLTQLAAGEGLAPLVIAARPLPTEEAAWSERRTALERAGAQVLAVDAGDNRAMLPWAAVRGALAQEHLWSVMVEGGATVIDSLLVAHEKEPCVDMVIITQSAAEIGDAGYGYTTALPLDARHTGSRLRRTCSLELPPDRIIALS